MKIEMDETSAWVTVICVVIVALLIGCLGGCYMNEQTEQKAIGAGLVQGTVPGNNYPVWKKP